MDIHEEGIAKNDDNVEFMFFQKWHGKEGNNSCRNDGLLVYSIVVLTNTVRHMENRFVFLNNWKEEESIIIKSCDATSIENVFKNISEEYSSN